MLEKVNYDERVEKFITYIGSCSTMNNEHEHISMRFIFNSIQSCSSLQISFIYEIRLNWSLIKHSYSYIRCIGEKLYVVLYKILSCINIWKFPKKNHTTFHNLHLHLAYWQTKFWIFIRHTVCEDLVKMKMHGYFCLQIHKKTT